LLTTQQTEEKYDGSNGFGIHGIRGFQQRIESHGDVADDEKSLFVHPNYISMDTRLFSFGCAIATKSTVFVFIR